MPSDGAAADDVEESIQELYGLPLQDFTSARNALAKRLTAGGDKATAASVKGLRKPSVTAWALNQLARRDPDGIAALLESGAQLRDAHRLALEGDASSLRAATRAEQQRVADLARKAAAILDEAGSSGGSHAERLAESLRAAATDQEAGAQLRQGRLTVDVESTGFGFPAGFDASPLARREPRTAVTETASSEAAGDDDADTAARQAEAREEARATAKRRLATAQRSAERRRAKATEAADTAARLSADAERAEEMAAEARRRARDAAREAAGASDEAAAADAAVDEAQRALDASA